MKRLPLLVLVVMVGSGLALAQARAARRRQLAVARLLLEEPHIEPKALEAIAAPTLVLAGDHDLIRDEHTVTIFHHIPNSQLAIFPNATHMIPFDDRRRSTPSSSGSSAHRS
jgi:pimeloyl-ACP methyl ester carboxylesterase